MSSRIVAVFVIAAVSLVPAAAAQSSEVSKLEKANRVQGTAVVVSPAPAPATTAEKAARGNLVQGGAGLGAQAGSRVAVDSARAAKLARANRVQGTEAPAEKLPVPSIPSLIRRGNLVQGGTASVTPDVASKP